MSKKIIDARGELCPRPLIMTKKALLEIHPGESFIVLVDNSAAKENVERFLKDNGQSVLVEQKGNDYQLTVGKNSQDLAHPQAEDYCPVVSHKHDRDGHVISISNNHMGQGPEDLTALLIQGFVNTIKEVSPHPKAIVFYTSGVFLTLEDSPVLLALKELEGMGVKILVCGTCLNFFEVKEKLAVGQVSNMYTILETLSHASHVVTPQ